MRVRRLLNVRRQVIVAVAIPLVARGVGLLAARLRDRRADSPAAARLDQAGRLLRRVQRFV